MPYGYLVRGWFVRNLLFNRNRPHYEVTIMKDLLLSEMQDGRRGENYMFVFIYI